MRETLEQLRRLDAGALYRMLWGYSNEQLLESEAVTLVNFLSHKDLDFRQLAYWNLRDITGDNRGIDLPHRDEPKRQVEIKRWRERLEKNEIVHPDQPRAGAPPQTAPPEGDPKPPAITPPSDTPPPAAENGAAAAKTTDPLSRVGAAAGE